MFEMPVSNNSILPCQEAFLVDAPTPNTPPRRWIQAKQKHWRSISNGLRTLSATSPTKRTALGPTLWGHHPKR